MKKLLILLACMIFLVSFVSAEGEELAFEPNETMNLKFYCFNASKALCDSGTICQITIYYPNMTVFIDNQSASNSGSYWNYSATETNTLGVYSAMVDCQSGGLGYGYQGFKFYVGRPSTLVQGQAISRSLYIFFGIAILMFIGFLAMPKPLFRWTFFLFFLLFLVAGINMISISLYNEAGSEQMISIFDTIGAGSYILYWFFGGLIAFLWIFSIFNTLSSRKTMRQAAAVGQSMEMEYRR